ncbi:hypothetical protein RF11_11538 [Thelohanellus kitauei]|uniref:Reverse transcriptase domain-containing protein n=1 Tax=Thelohanellus kitauei TaxID=669202 RepID=A0A0C2MVD2_THEKT|nr:hypothetical protein RF11_11538 [Thelohanellus kitauei]
MSEQVNTPEKLWNSFLNFYQLNREKINIVSGDKGGKIVIMNNKDYYTMGMDIIKRFNFEPLSDEKAVKMIDQIQNHQSEMTDLINSQFIDPQYERKIDCSNNKYPRYMYLLPKIHKETHEWLIPDKVPKGRPIISCSSAFLSTIGKFIDRNLKPLVFKKNPHFIRSSYELLKQLNDFILPNNVEFLVADRSELYLNIDVNLVTIKVFDLFCMSKRCEKAWLLEKLLKFDLTHQLFTFNGHYYRQPNGIFMGSPFSPSLAYLYLLHFDISVRNQANVHF